MTLSQVSTIADGIAVGRPLRSRRSGSSGSSRRYVVTVSRTPSPRPIFMSAQQDGGGAGRAVGVAAILEGELKRTHRELGTTVVCLPATSTPCSCSKVIQRGLSAAGRYMTIKMMLTGPPRRARPYFQDHRGQWMPTSPGVNHTRIGDHCPWGTRPSPSTWRPRGTRTATR
ncbi:hypothetical protein QJS66_08455 [Kocuria rhizophila]|nr:hypothetical protein QJS66_08455 [Kocuria rhizophila]